MSQCWYENPAHRPAFGVIRYQLDVLLGHHRNYLDLDNLDMSAAATGAGTGGCGGGASSLPTSLQLVYDVDDDDDVEPDRDSYVESSASSPLVVDGRSSSVSRTSNSSTTNLSLIHISEPTRPY